jgi:hypothetical protein
MMDDTFEGLEDDDLEEEADKEVDKILFEVTNGMLLGTDQASESKPVRPVSARTALR